MDISDEMVVGQKVYFKGTSTSAPGYGAIVEEWEPTAFVPLAFSILLDDGRGFYRVEQSELMPHPGRRFEMLGEIAPAEYLEHLRKKEAAYKAELEAKKAAAEEKFNVEVAKLKAEYPYLEEGKSSKTAARNIRALLKRRFPGVKFSVRNPHYSLVRVSWVGGPTVKQVAEITRWFEDGHFDGMTDTYEYRATPFNSTFGAVKYTDHSRAMRHQYVGGNDQ